MADEKEFRYILVGNIIDRHVYGEEKEVKSGTKHFRPGAKVYLFPKYGGMGHEKMPVFGLPKNSFKKIHVTITTNLIKNVRVKKTYDTRLIQKVDQTFFYSFADYTGCLVNLTRFADFVNENNVELKD